ncbi:MAG: hypothetical protein SF053_15990 [Bacteroidia bacterium]|nr:hypothetical protein [Bacteroidia bacterium]
MRFVWFLLMVLGVQATAHAQGKVSPLTTLPPDIQLKGQLIKGVSWQDQAGLNYFILAETAEAPSPGGDPDYREKFLYAWHYVRRADSLLLRRSITDFTKECPVDLSVNHIPESLTITDLDGDKLAEITFLYTIGCAGDVSPHTLKLMMLEDGAKYAIRGTTVMDGYPAEKNPDTALKAAPAVFQQYADKRWEIFSRQ